jgi:hypothetical protein
MRDRDGRGNRAAIGFEKCAAVTSEFGRVVDIVRNTAGASSMMPESP